MHHQNVEAESDNTKASKSTQPMAGKDPARTIRLSNKLMASVEHWAMQQADQPARSEAIRRLVEHSVCRGIVVAWANERDSRALHLARRKTPKRRPAD